LRRASRNATKLLSLTLNDSSLLFVSFLVFDWPFPRPLLEAPELDLRTGTWYVTCIENRVEIWREGSGSGEEAAGVA